MVHPANDLRSHIARRPTGLLRVAFLLLPRHSKVSDPQVPIFLEHQILRLQISMDNPFRVYELESIDDAPNDEL